MNKILNGKYEHKLKKIKRRQQKEIEKNEQRNIF